ncbi:hypothetical protein Acr_01g0001040 [Actinidia rufa]|uniref:Borealin C-terminal domain-containing protein n=1 Tax=Actinidia rufa TaxID=165716 RepID=A0A7J0E1B1_9ERIC|nr:hypothetical protein Acr_01g0001040 [Actinidia rufa]
MCFGVVTVDCSFCVLLLSKVLCSTFIQFEIYVSFDDYKSIVCNTVLLQCPTICLGVTIISKIKTVCLDIYVNVLPHKLHIYLRSGVKLSLSMAKGKVKRTVKQSASSPLSSKNCAGPKEPPILEKEDVFRDPEVERRSAAIRGIRDVEIDHLLTGLRLLRSYFMQEQLQTPVLQFFEENLPNLSVLRNGKDGHYEVQWKEKDGNLSMNQVDGRNIHSSLLHCMSITYPNCSAIPSFGGFDSSKDEKASLLGADNLQIRDFVCPFLISDLVLEEPSDTHMLGLQDALQTPGATSHRMSVGMTPKTLRLPKPGEMLLSVHGSPLGVYKEDNMESIQGTFLF